MSSRMRLAAAAALAIAVAFVLPSRGVEPAAKLDRALAGWLQQPTVSTRALISVRPDASDRIRHRIDKLTSNTAASAVAGRNLIAAELTPAALRTIASDADVLRLSSDALVRTLGAAELAQDVLLNTEALVPRKYNGAEIGVVIIDSGILPNANEKVTATYEFTNGSGKRVGALDPYGHGTHVTGLVASKGDTSHDLYEGIAPDARLYAFRALDQNGSGYTSNVIAAINFAIANKSALKIDVLNLSLGHSIYESASTDPL